MSERAGCRGRATTPPQEKEMLLLQTALRCCGHGQKWGRSCMKRDEGSEAATKTSSLVLLRKAGLKQLLRCVSASSVETAGMTSRSAEMRQSVNEIFLPVFSRSAGQSSAPRYSAAFASSASSGSSVSFVPSACFPQTTGKIENSHQSSFSSEALSLLPHLLFVSFPDY